MLNQSDLTASVDAYERDTLTSIQKAKLVMLPPPTHLCFSTLGLTEARITELAGGVTTGKKQSEIGSEFLYIFRLCAANSLTAEEVLKAFNLARTAQESIDYKGNKNLCRAHPLAGDSSAIYVGRSYSPRERLKQHLGSSSSGTYAIHFATWASLIDVKVEFYLYQFSGVGNRVIQVLEDGLWDRLRPMMGRRGEK